MNGDGGKEGKKASKAILWMAVGWASSVCCLTAVGWYIINSLYNK